MKSNKEKVYDFIRLHSEGENEAGVSTVYIAEAMELQRTNVSSILNQLVKESRICKSEGRPVLYRTIDGGKEQAGDCFSDLIGCEGSLKRVIQLAKAAVLYPQRSLNTLLIGARGTGKSRLAKRMYRFAVDRGIIDGEAPYLHIDCHDYLSNDRLETELEEIWRTAQICLVSAGRECLRRPGRRAFASRRCTISSLRVRGRSEWHMKLIPETRWAACCRRREFIPTPATRMMCWRHRRR